MPTDAVREIGRDPELVSRLAWIVALGFAEPPEERIVASQFRLLAEQWVAEGETPTPRQPRLKEWWNISALNMESLEHLAVKPGRNAERRLRRFWQQWECGIYRLN